MKLSRFAAALMDQLIWMLTNILGGVGLGFHLLHWYQYPTISRPNELHTDHIGKILATQYLALSERQASRRSGCIRMPR